VKVAGIFTAEFQVPAKKLAYFFRTWADIKYAGKFGRY